MICRIKYLYSIQIWYIVKYKYKNIKYKNSKIVKYNIWYIV